MKRILFLCLVATFIMSGVVSAEISKEKDESGLRATSSFKSYSGVRLDLSKSIIGKEVFYTIHASSKSNYAEYLLKDNAIAVGVDKYPDFYLDKYQYRKPFESYSYIEATVPLELVERIKSAKHIFITLATHKGSHFIADEILAEWKQVIATTE